MTMQSRLNHASLATLAICAAKALQIVYPYMKKVEVVEENSDYIVVGNDEKLVRIYRQDHSDGTFTHSWDEYQYNSFIVEDWEGPQEYRIYTIVSEFEEAFFTEVIMHQELPIERFPDEMVRDIVSIIYNHHDRVSVNFELIRLAGDIHIRDINGNDLCEAWYCYKPERLMTVLEEVMKLHNTYYE